MASAGTISVDFAAQTAEFQAELKKVRGSLNQLQGNFDAIGKAASIATRVFAGGALVSIAKRMFDAADAIGDAAARAGIAADSMSRLRYAAKQADVDFNTLAVSIRGFQKNLSLATDGNESAAKAFDAINVSAQSLRGLKFEDQLGRVADAFQRITDPADRTRIATELFGRAGQDLIPLLEQGSAGIAKLTKEADRLGITLTTEAAAGVAQMDEALKRLGSTIEGIGTRVFGNLALALTGPPQATLDLANRTRDLDGILLKAGGSAAELVRQKNLLLARSTGGEAPAFITALNVINAKIEEAATGLRGLQTSGHGAIGKQFKPFSTAVEEIDVSATTGRPMGLSSGALQALDAERERQQLLIQIGEQRAQAELQQHIARLQQFQAEQDAFMTMGAAITEQIAVDNQARLDLTAQSMAEYVQIQMQAEQSLQDMRERTFSLGIQALQAFAGQSKKVAIALVLINKAKTIAETIQNTAAGVAVQLASPPAHTAFARAAAVKAMGAAQVGLIAATAFGEIKSINANGGAVLGSPSNPVFTAGGLDDEGTRPGASSQSAVQIHFNGPIFDAQRTKDFIVNSLREEIEGRDVVIFSENSLQGQILRS